ncbi:hypothetical protein Tco_0247486 [Tanacetum coccineum]
MPTEMELTLEQTQQGVSYEISFDESNTHVLERFNTSAGNPVKEILLKLNLPDHRKLKDGGEASDKTTSLSASTFSCLNASLWAASIIPLTRLDFTLSFLLNASPTTFALSEYHTNHSSKSEKPLLVLRSTHTSDSSQLGK